MHSKKIGTVLSVGLIQRFLFCLINLVGLIGLLPMWVKLFFNEADVATALDACHSNLRKVIGMRAKTHVLIQIMY